MRESTQRAKEVGMKLGVGAIRRMLEVASEQSKLHKSVIERKPHWRLRMPSAAPLGEGGLAIVKTLMKWSREDGLPLYCEAYSLEEVEWFENWGFLNEVKRLQFCVCLCVQGLCLTEAQRNVLDVLGDGASSIEAVKQTKRISRDWSYSRRDSWSTKRTRRLGMNPKHSVAHARL